MGTGPQGPPGIDATIDYVKLINELAVDPKFQTALNQYITNNKSMFKGDKGDPGVNFSTLTDDQISKLANKLFTDFGDQFKIGIANKSELRDGLIAIMKQDSTFRGPSGLVSSTEQVVWCADGTVCTVPSGKNVKIGDFYLNPGTDKWLNIYDSKNTYGGLGIATDNVKVGTNTVIGGNKLETTGRMHITGTDDLFVLNNKGMTISKAWGGNGNLSVDGDIYVGGRLLVNSIGIRNAVDPNDYFIIGNSGAALDFTKSGGGAVHVMNDGNLRLDGTWGQRYMI